MGYSFEAHVPHNTPWFAWLVNSMGPAGDKYSVLNSGQSAVVKFRTLEDRQFFLTKWSDQGAIAIAPSARGVGDKKMLEIAMRKLPAFLAEKFR